MNVKYLPTFIRKYKKLSKALQEEVKEKIEVFCGDPKHPCLKTHKLKGKLKKRYSFSVNYKYRILFFYESKDVAILISVGDHDVYDK